MTGEFTAAELERWLGNADDPANPVGMAAFLGADELGDLLPAGRTLLESCQLGAELVPAALGGRFRQAGRLVQVLRSVFRRDAALGYECGIVNLTASAPVWSAAVPQQQRWLAGILLRGGQIAAGVAPSGTVCDQGQVPRLTPATGEGQTLTGREDLVTGIATADALTLLARDDDGQGHRLLLLDLRALPRDRLRFLPRQRMAALRAAHIAGVEFLNCPLPAAAVLGPPGDAPPTASAEHTAAGALQVAALVLSGAVLGTFDTQLRLVTRFALERQLYSRPVAELPHPRSVLAGAVTDLLICDCLGTAACRALHLLPGQAAAYAPAVEYLSRLLITESVEGLAVVLGARSFLREGPYGSFQKHMRDLSAIFLLHPALPAQLPGLKDDGSPVAQPAPATLFRPGDALPALDFGRLETVAGAEDGLLATLPALHAELSGIPSLAGLSGALIAQLKAVEHDLSELTPDAPCGAGTGLAERYAVLLAAAACAGVWQNHRDDPFLGGTAWLTLALGRVARLLGHQVPDGDSEAERAVFTELTARVRANRAFDLGGQPLG